MVLGKLFKKRETLVGLDIGSSTIKLVELDFSSNRPELINVGIASTPPDAITGKLITKPEAVADTITALFEDNEISEDSRVAVSVPASSVFTKRVKLPWMSLTELADNIQLEASSFIPHNINAVKLDYHILGESGKSQLDVLVVAVKEEVVSNILDTLSFAGLEAAVVDVDFFAVQNIFELCYPERLDKTVALVNVGSRLSSINVCSRGASLFTGDVSLGGKLFTEELVEQLAIDATEAEEVKRSVAHAGARAQQAQEIVQKNVEHVASEINRQLSFVSSESESEESIEQIVIAGGGAQIPGLFEKIAEKTGIACEYLDPLRGITVPDGFESAYINELAPVIGVAAGLALRQPGDKIVPGFME